MKRWMWFAAGVVLLACGVLIVPFIYMSGTRTFQEITIPAEGYTIQGYLSLGTSTSGPWIIFCHGNRKEGQAHELYQRILKNLPDDATVLAIDFRGFGRSSSESISASDKLFDRSIDIDAAVAYLMQNHGAQRHQVILIGHSLGALQVLKAAHDQDYNAAIALGPGNFDLFLEENALSNYLHKFHKNTGIALTPEDMLREGSRFTPSALFTPCPQTSIVLMFGAYDHKEMLLYHQDQIPSDCRSAMRWIVVPFSEHMYGTETFSLPKPLRSLYSTVSLSLLKWELHHLLKEATNDVAT